MEWIVGLACNTLYHFRAVATNASGTTIGSDATLTTWLGCTASSGDVDGDGKMDLGVYRPSEGVWYILQSSTNYTTDNHPQAIQAASM